MPWRLLRAIYKICGGYCKVAWISSGPSILLEGKLRKTCWRMEETLKGSTMKTNITSKLTEISLQHSKCPPEICSQVTVKSYFLLPLFKKFEKNSFWNSILTVYCSYSSLTCYEITKTFSFRCPLKIQTHLDKLQVCFNMYDLWVGTSCC